MTNLRDELKNAPVEPLLPIEKKLIGWSLGIGLVLLGALVALNYLYPINVPTLPPIHSLSFSLQPSPPPPRPVSETAPREFTQWLAAAAAGTQNWKQLRSPGITV